MRIECCFAKIASTNACAGDGKPFFKKREPRSSPRERFNAIPASFHSRYARQSHEHDEASNK